MLIIFSKYKFGRKNMGCRKLDQKLSFVPMKCTSLLFTRNFIGQADLILKESIRLNIPNGICYAI
jgi:hypothetical protein